MAGADWRGRSIGFLGVVLGLAEPLQGLTTASPWMTLVAAVTSCRGPLSLCPGRPGSMGSQLEHGAGDNPGLSGQLQWHQGRDEGSMPSKNPRGMGCSSASCLIPQPFSLSAEQPGTKGHVFHQRPNQRFIPCHFHTLRRLCLVCGHTGPLPLPLWLSLDTLSRHIPGPGADPSAGASYAVASSSAGC